MIKFLCYLPAHILNTWLAHLAPHWIFKVTYKPSTEAEREQEEWIRNKVRKATYWIK